MNLNKNNIEEQKHFMTEAAEKHRLFMSDWWNLSSKSTRLKIIVSILALYVLNEQNNYLQKLNIFQWNKCSRYLFQFIHRKLPENRKLIYESSLKWQLIYESSMINENWTMKAHWHMKIDLWKLPEIWKLIYESSLKNENWCMKALWKMKHNLWKLSEKWNMIYESSLKYKNWP
jgi:hypothetical protein